uniref:Uncharacterized protein n=1 Tax=Rhipicephalus zambeziensis TaxID=60191 RepID=A0A224YFZ4_9ACAR
MKAFEMLPVPSKMKLTIASTRALSFYKATIMKPAKQFTCFYIGGNTRARVPKCRKLFTFICALKKSVSRNRGQSPLPPASPEGTRLKIKFIHSFTARVKQ